MPSVTFTQNLKRHLSAPPRQVEGNTVREALNAVFGDHPALRSYILDDQGRLRQHIVIFIDGEMIHDRMKLSDAVGPQSDLFVIQALSGG